MKEIGHRARKIMVFEAYCGELYGNQHDVLLWFKYINKRRFQMLLVTPTDGKLTQAVQQVGGEVAIVPASTGLSLYGGKLWNMSLYQKLKAFFELLRYNVTIIKLIRTKKIDIIICNNLRSVLMVALASKLAVRPIIWYIKGELVNPLLDKIALLAVDKILLVTRALGVTRYGFELGRLTKIDDLPLGIECNGVVTGGAGENITQYRKASDSGLGVRFAYMGALTQSKGLHVLIRAFVRVVRSIPGAELYVLGDTEDKEQKHALREIVRGEKLEQHVHWMGWQSDTVNILKEVDVVVLPSFTEGMPRALMEAMALGKAVIGTSVGGIPELLCNGECGIVVEPGKEECLASAMVRAAMGKELREKLGKNAMQRIRTSFEIGHHVERLEEVLNTV